jgi:hypothetical protein
MSQSQQKISTRIINVDPRELKLLEQNARYMRHEQFAQLVNNVKNDGKLTSVPFACKEGDKYLVLSGNHRVAASIEAGLEEIAVMVTDDEISHSQKIAIQLSHNAIAGEDDPAVLKALYEQMDDIDWRIYSGLDDKTLDLLEQIQVGSIGEANLTFQTLTIVFLPSELEEARASIEEAMTLSKGADERWVARFEEHDKMLDALHVTGTSHNVSNVATGLAIILEIFNRHKTDLVEGWYDEAKQEPRHGKWIPLETITGATAPPASAAVIKQAIDKLAGNHQISNGWQALELICADYLAG